MQSINVVCSGETSLVDVDFVVNDEDDFLVLGEVDGVIYKNIDFSWDAQNSKLTISNPRADNGEWNAYIFRNEQAQNNITTTANGTASMAAIIAQFAKDNRVLQQLQDAQGKSLRSPDDVDYLPTKDVRKGKVLSFDAEGNPITVVVQEDVEKIKEYRNSAEASKNQARVYKEATELLKSDTASLKSETAQIKNATENLVDGFDGKVEEATENFNENATGKTNAYNQNASAKVLNFNSFVSEKTEEFKDTATEKTNDFDANYRSKKASLEVIANSVNGAVDKAQSYKSQAEVSAQNANLAQGQAELSANRAETEKQEAMQIVSDFEASVDNEIQEAKEEVAEEKVASINSIKGAFDREKSQVLGDISAVRTNAIDDVNKAKDDALDSIEEYTDPDGRIAKLEAFKANNGALHCSAGRVQTSNQIDFSGVSSIAWRQKIPASSLNTIGTFQNGLIIGSMLYGSMCKITASDHATIPNEVDWTLRDSNGTKTIRMYPLSSVNIFDNSWHSIVITSGVDNVKCYIDGVLRGTLAVSEAQKVSQQRNFIISNITEGFVGDFSDVRVFNFDMSTDDALYTVSDYARGKAIPPSALNAIQEIDYSANWATTDSKTFSISTYTNGEDVGVIEANLKTDSSTYYLNISYTLSVALQTGSRVRMKYDSLEFQSTSATIRGININFYDASYTLIDRINLVAGEWIEYPSLSRPCSRIVCGFLTQASERFSAGDIATLTGLQIEVDGAIIALENYTVMNGNTQTVFDLSPSLNDATVSGNVIGDNDTRVSRLISLIQSQI